MVAADMVHKGTSVRQVARQMGVSEGALRYRLKKRAEGPGPDGRALQPTATDGYEDAIRAILEAAEDARLTGEGRPMQARRVYDLLARDYGYSGSYQAVVRHLRRTYGVPKLRALRRVETPPACRRSTTGSWSGRRSLVSACSCPCSSARSRTAGRALRGRAARPTSSPGTRVTSSSSVATAACRSG